MRSAVAGLINLAGPGSSFAIANFSVTGETNTVDILGAGATATTVFTGLLTHPNPDTGAPITDAMVTGTVLLANSANAFGGSIRLTNFTYYSDYEDVDPPPAVTFSISVTQKFLYSTAQQALASEAYDGSFFMGAAGQSGSLTMDASAQGTAVGATLRNNKGFVIGANGQAVSGSAGPTAFTPGSSLFPASDPLKPTVELNMAFTVTLTGNGLAMKPRLEMPSSATVSFVPEPPGTLALLGCAPMLLRKRRGR